MVGTGQMRPTQPEAVHGGQLVSSLQPPHGLFASVSLRAQASGWRFADAGPVCTERDVGQQIKGGIPPPAVCVVNMRPEAVRSAQFKKSPFL